MADTSGSGCNTFQALPPVTPKLYGRDQPFRWRYAYFRYLCSSSMAMGSTKINVDRETLLEDSFAQVLGCPAHNFRRRLYVVFNAEDGLDYGGPAREWFLLVSHQVLNPAYDLFEYVSSKNYALQINPDSSKLENYQLYYRFFGRFLGLALYQGCFIYTGFCLPFYKKMLGKELEMDDLSTIDPEFYNSLKWVETTNMDETDTVLHFSSDFTLRGETTVHELKPGGAQTRVTEDNKAEYIELMMHWRMTRGQDEQMAAFLDGLNEVIPLEWLQYFNESELEMVLCGRQEIDVDDWERNTVYRHYTKTSQEIVWFWEFVRSLDNESRARLLQFVTGSCRVPLGGFAELMGSDTNAPQKFCIDKLGKVGSLPRSHTCFNRLDLPSYASYDQLCERMAYALTETEGFGQK